MALLVGDFCILLSCNRVKNSKAKSIDSVHQSADFIWQSSDFLTMRSLSFQIIMILIPFLELNELELGHFALADHTLQKCA